MVYQLCPVVGYSLVQASGTDEPQQQGRTRRMHIFQALSWSPSRWTCLGRWDHGVGNRNGLHDLREWYVSFQNCFKLQIQAEPIA